MNRETDSIHFGGDNDGWRIEGAVVFGATEDYPDTDIQCAHCNKVIAEGSENDASAVQTAG